MTNQVPDNPFDTQPSNSTTGIVAGQLNNVDTGANQSTAVPTAKNPAANLDLQQYTPEQREVDQATETAAGQTESLLSNPDSPLLARARTLGLQNISKRGLVSSSMGQEAGVAAMIDRITPIAINDANTYTSRASENMAASNEALRFNAGENNKLVSQGWDIASRYGLQDDAQEHEVDLQTAQFNFQDAQNRLDRALQLQLQDKSIAAQKELQAAEIAYNRARDQLDRQLQREQLQIQANLEQQRIDAQARLQESQYAFQAMQADLDRQNQVQLMDYQARLNQYNGSLNFAANASVTLQQTIANIVANPEMNKEAKDAAIDNAIAVANSQLEYGAAIFGTDMPAIGEPKYGQTGIFEGGTSVVPPSAPAPINSGMTYTSPRQVYTDPKQYGGTVQDAYNKYVSYSVGDSGLEYWGKMAVENGWSNYDLDQAIKNAAIASGEAKTNTIVTGNV